MMQPIWLKTLIEPSVEPQPDQRAGHRQRHRHHDDERMAEAFELRGQHQEHDHQRQQEGHVQRAAGALELARFAVVVDLRLRRQLVAHHLLQIVERLAQRIAGREIRPRS